MTPSLYVCVKEESLPKISTPYNKLIYLLCESLPFLPTKVKERIIRQFGGWVFSLRLKWPGKYSEQSLSSVLSESSHMLCALLLKNPAALGCSLVSAEHLIETLHGSHLLYLGNKGWGEQCFLQMCPNRAIERSIIRCGCPSGAQPSCRPPRGLSGYLCPCLMPSLSQLVHLTVLWQ